MMSERIRNIPTSFSKDIELDKRIAKYMGLKRKDYGYKSLTPVQNTIFTSPPEFTSNPNLVNTLITFAKEKELNLPKWTYDPYEISKAIDEQLGGNHNQRY